MCNDPTPLGRLHRLLLLYVGHNALSGGIPATIVNLITMLHALDLSFNQLFGPIPAELQGLCDLDRASLQMNYNSGFMPNDLSNNTSFVDSQNWPKCIMNSVIMFLSSRRLENIFRSSHLEFGRKKQLFERLTQPKLA